MILVDTTVWIDLFAGRNLAHVKKLEMAIEAGEDICTCGVVMTEVLQGIREDEAFHQTLKIMEDLIYLPETVETFIKAAQIYRTLRKRGKTIRNPVDCIIAAVCILHGAFILHNDRDFGHIADIFPLQSI
jgi:predicted nucleic acid-binding protein